MANYSVEFHTVIVTVLSTTDTTTNLQLTTLVWLQVWLTDQQQLWQQDTNSHLLLTFGQDIYITTRLTKSTVTIMTWNSPITLC